MSAAQLHILMGGMSKGTGGKETYIIGMTRELVKLGARIDFITPDLPMAYEDEATDLGCRVFRIPQRSASPLGLRKAIADIYIRESFDVIWSHKTTLSSTEDLSLARKRGIPIRIVHSHCTQNMGNQFTAIMHALHKRTIGRIVTHRFACSEEAGRYFYPGGLSFSIKKNAFDLDAYLPNQQVRDAYRRQLGIEGAFVVGHVGRFSPEKNHAKLLQVFSEVVQRKPQAVLVLCGDGETKAETQQLADELGLSKRVRFLGSRDDVPSILQAMDAFVFPSIHEGLPFALLEAQAVGIPCVMSTGIPPEAVYGANVDRLPNDLADTHWADRVLELAEMARVSSIPAMRDDGLDIHRESANLYDELCRLYHASRGVR